VYRQRAMLGCTLRRLPLLALLVCACTRDANDVGLEARGADGYTKTLAPELLGRDDALVAYAVDDRPLADGEGPLRLVIPGSQGLSVRQLVRLSRP